MSALERLRRAAAISLAVHFVAGLALLLVLGRGLATNPDLQDRLRFLAERPWVWRAGWLTWNAAALSVLWYFRAYVDARAEECGAAGRLAVALGVCAVAADLSAEALLMGPLPGLAAAARRVPDRLVDFLAVERAAVLLTGGLANGLYTLVSVWLAWLARRSHPRWVTAAGLLIALPGFALSIAAVVGSVPGLYWSNAALVPLIVAWQLGVLLSARS